jgi:hypothetical protein
MQNPQQITKIELVTEAIETLVLATVVAQGSGDRAAHHQNILDARKTVHDALAMLLQPTLRVFTNEKKIDESIPYGGEGISGMDIG